MVRNYKKKTNRASISEDTVQAALNDILQNKRPIREAALHFGIKKSTLHTRLKKKLSKTSFEDSGNESDSDDPKHFSKYGSRQVFSVEDEEKLVDYLKTSSDINYGLSFQSCRTLAYELACELKSPYPPSWDTNKRAGKDWMQSFMKRHKDLTYRKPENTSLARATAFNKHNVDQFFDNYILVQKKYKFTPDRILNTDESGISTVLQAPKVIAPKGKKQVGQIVSGERGTLVTFCATVIASGNTVPPLYIFPRTRIKDAYLTGSVTGSIAHGSKTGWMTTEIFLKLLKHIQGHTKSCIENPILLLLDNHETHTDLAVINFCRKYGIVLLTFPPHCTHRMQPLDIGLYGPLKNRLKTAFNDFMVMNPGQPIRIDNIASLSATPYLLSFTPTNITNAFKQSGIWPINRLAFDEKDFAAAYVTDRPKPQSELPSTSKLQVQSQEGNTSCSVIACQSESQADVPSSSNDVGEQSGCQARQIKKKSIDSCAINIISDITIKHNEIIDNCADKHEIVEYCLDILLDCVMVIVKTKTKSKSCISPFNVRPLPKAPPRKSKENPRKGKSRIFTSTPEKVRLEELEQKRLEKLNKKKNTKRKIDCNDRTQTASIKNAKPSVNSPKQYLESSAKKKKKLYALNQFHLILIQSIWTLPNLMMIQIWTWMRHLLRIMMKL